MYLKFFKLRNFRAYKQETVLTLNDLTALIGKNDVGKSTVLEAMEIFFNPKSKIAKIEAGDLCVNHDEGDFEVELTAVFMDLPAELTLDSGSLTTLEGEYLLNAEGDLEVIKKYDCSKSSPGEKIFIRANHPTADQYANLLEQKNVALKRLANDLEISNGEYNARNNASLRKAIWTNSDDLQLQEILVDANKEDGKKVWEALNKYLPVYALFQSDRKSGDQDSEVQDPMKLAIEQAIKDVEEKLAEVQKYVKDEVTKVAERTLGKLKEMAPDVASELAPDFSADPQWSKLFKMELNTDSRIPVNKRGSGVRRLILLNFFRAEAERKMAENSKGSVIYAFEEPETSQHPDNQQMLVEALQELARAEGCQVLLTTHTPAIGGLLDVEDLRYIHRENGNNKISEGNEATYEKVADALGVLPDTKKSDEVEFLLYVEGPHDVEFLKRASRILYSADSNLIDLENDPRVAFVISGGGTLKYWVENEYLKKLNLKEGHIYDRDDQSPPKYEEFCDKVNARGDGSWAVLTTKREMENYIHEDAINQEWGLAVSIDDDMDVSTLVAQVRRADKWSKWSDQTKNRTIRYHKKELNSKVMDRMTHELLMKRDSEGEIKGWLEKIVESLEEEVLSEK